MKEMLRILNFPIVTQNLDVNIFLEKDKDLFFKFKCNFCMVGFIFNMKPVQLYRKIPIITVTLITRNCSNHV